MSWFRSEGDCDCSNGEPAADYMPNCVDDDDPYACAEAGLDDAGDDGCYLEITGDVTFQNDDVVYMLIRKSSS